MALPTDNNTPIVSAPPNPSSYANNTIPQTANITAIN